MKNTFLIAFALILFTSCGNDDTSNNTFKDYTEENDAEILAYIEANELSAQKTDSVFTTL
ncbi:hypothetical protein [Algibacter lectus]|uniref:Uncharacterized protein n=1 Tax=Algibacter lectus TaxID=221126 RepID=A0A090WAH1_9FLAO|nr:hypothetical protein JCM19300_4602 [Algibacter lectus]GAL81637.1 hypothetical protein JCM19274_482 [Algibacter lectus]